MTKAYIFLLFFLSLNSWADQEITPTTKVFVSPTNSHYLRIVPAKDFKQSKARSYVYMAGNPSDHLLYEINSWYSSSVLVSASGQYIALLGPWPVMGSPANETPALAFYKNGTPTKNYMVSELIVKPKELPRSVSHYSWGGKLQWTGDWWNDTIQVTTEENRVIKFNIKTGEILE